MIKLVLFQLLPFFLLEKTFAFPPSSSDHLSLSFHKPLLVWDTKGFVCVCGRSWERKMGTSVQVTPLCGVYNENPLSYLVSIDDFNFLIDCGWNDHFDPSLLQPLSRSFSLCFNFFFVCWEALEQEIRRKMLFFMWGGFIIMNDNEIDVLGMFVVNKIEFFHVGSSVTIPHPSAS